MNEPRRKESFNTSRQNAMIDVLAVVGASVGYVILEAFQVPKRWSFVALSSDRV